MISEEIGYKGAKNKSGVKNMLFVPQPRLNNLFPSDAVASR